MYTDTHFHYQEMQKKGFSIEELISDFSREGISLAIDIGLHGGEDIQERIDALQGLPQVFFSSGYHPSQTMKVSTKKAVESLHKQLDHPGIVAVGETGVDTYRDCGPVEKQQELFRIHLELANQYELPIIIHCRQAGQQVIEVLSSYPAKAGGILHCFEGSHDFAQQVLSHGLHISFAGNITFSRNQELREVAAAIPANRILLETDSPYLTPVPHRGKPNSPGKIIHTYQTVAALRETSMEDLCQQVRTNTLNLFSRIDESKF